MRRGRCRTTPRPGASATRCSRRRSTRASPAGRRARLHARAAERPRAQHGADPSAAIAELAHHHHQALARRRPRARLRVRGARRRARAPRCSTTSRRRCTGAQALAALDHARAASIRGRRLAALLALGEALRLAGDRARAARGLRPGARDRRARLGRADALVAAAIGFCDLTEWAPSDEAARTALREALARGPGDALAAARSVLTRLAYLDIREARERAEPLAARGRRAGARHGRSRRS